MMSKMLHSGFIVCLVKIILKKTKIGIGTINVRKNIQRNCVILFIGKFK